MAVSETFFRRLIVEMKRSSRPGVTRLLDDAKSDIKWVVPVDVHLPKGAKAVAIPIAATVEMFPSRAIAVLKTSRPGCVARLSQLNTTPTCRASGTLVSVSDNIYDDWDGISVQDEYWQSGKWSSTLGNTLSSVEDSNWSHEVVQAIGMPSASGINAFATFRAYDLGQQNDGKIFQFWVKIPFSYSGETLESAYIDFCSWPYGDATHDDDIDALGGDGTDNNNIPNAFTPRFQFNFYSVSGSRVNIVDDTWSMVTARKEAFANVASETDQPLWDRVMNMNIRALYSGVIEGAEMRIGSVYFGDRLENEFDSVIVQSYIPTASVPLVLSLDGPSDGPAHIEGLVMVE